MPDYSYIGDELSRFALAENWKGYWLDSIQPYLGRRVLEAGAGIGTNTTLLLKQTPIEEITCLEPDAKLAEQLRGRLQSAENGPRFQIRIGDTTTLDPGACFDAALYIDVLEHIEDDAGELRRVSRHLHPGGRVVVLSPAHQFLFSPFDRAIGHFRRYDRKTLRRIGPEELELEALFYLDAVGMLASLANKLLLRQAYPTPKQLRFWDRWMVPLSRAFLDRITGYHLGKTIVGVWRRGS